MSTVEVKGYKHKIGSHCSSTLLRNILSSNGLDISEELCFGIGAGLGFIYRKAFNPPYYFVLGRSDDIEEKVCFFLGGMALKYTTDDNNRAWYEAKKLIQNNEPVLINVDASHLSYLRHKFNLFDNVRYGGHRALITAYDEDAQIARLADYLWNEPQNVSLKELEQSRASKTGQTPPENLFYTFLFPKEFAPLEQAVRGGIKLNVNAMLNPWYEVLGLPGLKKFCERVVHWPKFMNTDLVKTNAYMTYMMTEVVGTGGGNFRRLYSRFLREAQEVLKDGRLERPAKLYAELGRLWKEVSYLLKASSGDITKGLWSGNSTNQVLLDTINHKEEEAILLLKEIDYV